MPDAIPISRPVTINGKVVAMTPGISENSVIRIVSHLREIADELESGARGLVGLSLAFPPNWTVGTSYKISVEVGDVIPADRRHALGQGQAAP